MLVEEDETYINGILVGHTDNQYSTRKYLVPHGVLHAGCNDITIRITSTRGVFRTIEGQNYSLEIGDECYFLAGEWQYQIGVIDNQWIPKETVLQYLPYGVYNQMLAPLSNVGVTGILWYQGESNTGQPSGYCDKMEKLVEQFRDLFHKQDIPFVYVQLPDYVDPYGESGEGLEELQKQQQKFADRNLKGVRMIPYLDVEDKFNLHPTDKKVVGERLAAGILALRED